MGCSREPAFAWGIQITRRPRSISSRRIASIRVPHTCVKSAHHEGVDVFIVICRGGFYKRGALMVRQVDDPPVVLLVPGNLRRLRPDPLPFYRLVQEVGEHRELPVYGRLCRPGRAPRPLVSLDVEGLDPSKLFWTEERDDVLAELPFLALMFLPPTSRRRVI